MVQEALTNVAKHACAERVRVAVSAAGGELRIEVQDDGGGFDPSSVDEGSAWLVCKSERRLRAAR